VLDIVCASFRPSGQAVAQREKSESKTCPFEVSYDRTPSKSMEQIDFCTLAMFIIGKFSRGTESDCCHKIFTQLSR
jgi:hypothetical protein